MANLNINDVIMPTNQLINTINQYAQAGDQKLVNYYAYILATRIYVPESDIKFEDILTSCGYKKIETKELKLK